MIALIIQTTYAIIHKEQKREHYLQTEALKSFRDEGQHVSSVIVPQILDVTVADGEEDGVTRPLHTGPSDCGGEPQQCRTNHLDKGMYSSRTH
jgi:hypothetical protein